MPWPLAERWIVRGLIGIELPQLYILPGGGEWFLIGGLLGLFGLLYFWRVRGSGGDRSPLALIHAALLFLIGLIAYKFMIAWDLPGVVVAGTLTFALYIFLLHGRAQQSSARFSGEFLLSLEAAVPLLILVLANLAHQFQRLCFCRLCHGIACRRADLHSVAAERTSLHEFVRTPYPVRWRADADWERGGWVCHAL